jgi:cyclohexa-1,5-dienecarbonyl-CoA hydratase
MEEATMATFVQYVADADVARITLDRPPLNVLHMPMIDALNDALDCATVHPNLKAVVLAATGKAFSAGVAVEDHLGARARPMLDAFHGVFRRLRALECVTIAAVQGAALGGGAELATFCDVVIAADNATLGQPEIKVGVFPPIAALHYPLRVGYARALRLILSGEILSATDAAAIGLVDRVVPAQKLADAIDAEVARYRSLSAIVLRLAKRAVRDPLRVDFSEDLATLEELYHDELMTTADAEEGLRAFVEKRKPVWQDR